MTLIEVRATLHRLLGFNMRFVVLAIALLGAVEQAHASTCPSPGAVWSGVARLVGRDQLPQTEPPAALVIRDDGDRYQVELPGRNAEYTDPTRDCDQRAEVAAVFVALVLVPPKLVEATPEVGSRKDVRAGQGGLRLELSPWTGVAGFSERASVLALGGGLRLAGGRGAVAGVVGLSASWPTTLPTDGSTDVREQRAGGDLGVRFLRRGAVWEGTLDLQGVFGFVRVKPIGASGTTSLDWGGRVAVTLASVKFERLVPLIGGFGELSLRPRSVALSPVGVVGQTSRLRAGITVGVGWKIH